MTDPVSDIRSSTCSRVDKPFNRRARYTVTNAVGVPLIDGVRFHLHPRVVAIWELARDGALAEALSDDVVVVGEGARPALLRDAFKLAELRVRLGDREDLSDGTGLPNRYSEVKLD